MREIDDLRFIFCHKKLLLSLLASYHLLFYELNRTIFVTFVLLFYQIRFSNCFINIFSFIKQILVEQNMKSLNYRKEHLSTVQGKAS